jgi:predicted ester cyclase
VREPQSISSSSNQLEAMIRAYPDEVFNRHDLSQLDRYMSVDLISTWFGDRTLRGLPAWRDAMAGFFAAFPDAAFILDDILLRRRQAAWRGTRRATQARRMRRHRSHQP